VHEKPISDLQKEWVCEWRLRENCNEKIHVLIVCHCMQAAPSCTRIETPGWLEHWWRPKSTPRRHNAPQPFYILSYALNFLLLFGSLNKNTNFRTVTEYMANFGGFWPLLLGALCKKNSADIVKTCPVTSLVVLLEILDRLFHIGRSTHLSSDIWRPTWHDADFLLLWRFSVRLARNRSQVVIQCSWRGINLDGMYKQAFAWLDDAWTAGDWVSYCRAPLREKHVQRGRGRWNAWQPAKRLHYKIATHKVIRKIRKARAVLHWNRNRNVRQYLCDSNFILYNQGGVKWTTLVLGRCMKTNYQMCHIGWSYF